MHGRTPRAGVRITRREVAGAAAASQMLAAMACRRSQKDEVAESQPAAAVRAEETFNLGPQGIRLPALFFFPELRRQRKRGPLFVEQVAILPAEGAGRPVSLAFSGGKSVRLSGARGRPAKVSRQSLCVGLFVGYAVDAACKMVRLPVRLAEDLLTQRHLDIIPVDAAADLLSRILGMGKGRTITSIRFDSARREFIVA